MTLGEGPPTPFATAPVRTALSPPPAQRSAARGVWTTERGGGTDRLGKAWLIRACRSIT